MHRRRKPTDATVLGKPMARTQHDHLLIKRTPLGVFESLRDSLPCIAMKPGNRLGQIVAFRCLCTELAQDGTCLHRGELVFIPQEHQACGVWQCPHSSSHHLQVNHRGLINHQEVDRQLLVLPIAKGPTVKTCAQQSVHRGYLGGDALEETRIVPHDGGEMMQGASQRPLKSRGRFASGCGQQYPQGAPGGLRQGQALQQG